MNSIINNFLLAGDLRQPGFTYSACRSFTKNKERIKKSRKKKKRSMIYLSKRIR